MHDCDIKISASNSSDIQRVVLIGGGHTHALVLRKWGENPLPNVHLSVINPGRFAAYSGMLPGYIAGHYKREELDLDIVSLAEFARADCILDHAVGINTAERQVILKSGEPLPYDYISIDVGITSKLTQLAGFSDHGTSAKPLDRFAQDWHQFLQQVDFKKSPPNIAVIGGGVAGAELALSMAHALRSNNDARITLIDRSDILSEMRPHARQSVIRALKSYAVDLKPFTDVSALEAGAVITRDANRKLDRIASNFTVSAAGARPHAWVSDIGCSQQSLELEAGFIKVNTYLQSSDPRIFAVGDCAHMTQNPRPKAGVYAVRQAPVLAENLRNILQGKSLRPYIAQSDYLKLMSLGRKHAVADKGLMRMQGALIWQWKNRIDQAFMSQFKDLPHSAPQRTEQ